MLKYIGKTEFSIEKRFKEHINDSKKKRCEKRPLYNAMNKYGDDKFSVHLIEETNNPEEREIYWIEKYDSYRNGYNATLGGDSRHYIDYDLIVEKYNEIKNAKEVSRILNIDYKIVLNIIKNKNIKRYKQPHPTSKTILMFSVDNMFLKEFKSIAEAGRYILEIGLTKGSALSAKKSISHCLNGESKSSYGFLWKWKEESSE